MIKKLNNQYARRICTLLAIVFYKVEFAQAQMNLIPNPSFEQIVNTPSIMGQFFCSDWYRIVNSPDLFTLNSPITQTNNPFCSVGVPYNAAGFQYPRTGNNYIGIANRAYYPPNQGNPAYATYFEMFSNKLNQPLIKNHVYDFTLFYNLSNMSDIVNNQLSALFTVNQASISSNFIPTQQWYDSNINNLNPQINNDTNNYLISDTLNWTPLNGCFIAEGSEEYVTIGNFRDNKFNRTKNVITNYNLGCNSSPTNWSYVCYLYIDDVSLYDRGYYSGKVNVKRDTTICFNASMVLGNNAKDSSTYVWSPQIGLSCTNCPNPIASPSVTTKYYVTKTLCSYVTKDSITVTVHRPTNTATAGTNYTVCLGENKPLPLGRADSSSFVNYAWLPPTFLNCSNCATPFSLPINNITYQLNRTECNVTTTSTVSITLEDCETTYTVPSIFTPNNDGVNDVWGVYFNQIRYLNGFAAKVYNRWGTLIYDSERPNQRWDGHTTSGEQVSDGIYFYTVEFLVNDKPVKLKGTVTLLR